MLGVASITVFPSYETSWRSRGKHCNKLQKCLQTIRTRTTHCQSTVAWWEGLKTVADCQRKQQHKKILNSEGSQHFIGLHTLSLHLHNQDTCNSRRDGQHGQVPPFLLSYHRFFSRNHLCICVKVISKMSDAGSQSLRTIESH